MTKVKVDVASYLYNTPSYENRGIGFAYRDGILDVIGNMKDEDGREWLQAIVYIEEVRTVPVAEIPTSRFYSPVGTAEERESKNLWPGNWYDVLPFLHLNKGSYHTGADLNLNYPVRNADKGMPVYCTSMGVVIFAGPIEEGTWGKVVVVKHGPSLFSRYAHLETINIEVGEEVTKDTQLGTIGTMPGVPYSEYLHHLHFDISNTEVLEKEPGHWPGADKREVIKNYVSPKQFLQETMK